MLSKMFTRQARLDDADPAQRLLALTELPPDAEDFARLLAADPAPAVRAAAARQCGNLDALAQAGATEADAEVRAALEASLANALAGAPDDDRAATILGLIVARCAPTSRAVPRPGVRSRPSAARSRRRRARRTRMRRGRAGAGRAAKLYDVAKNKDRGVARLAAAAR
jgi:hypothetical protein